MHIFGRQIFIPKYTPRQYIEMCYLSFHNYLFLNFLVLCVPAFICVYLHVSVCVPECVWIIVCLYVYDCAFVYIFECCVCVSVCGCMCVPEFKHMRRGCMCVRVSADLSCWMSLKMKLRSVVSHLEWALTLFKAKPSVAPPSETYPFKINIIWFLSRTLFSRFLLLFLLSLAPYLISSTYIYCACIHIT